MSTRIASGSLIFLWVVVLNAAALGLALALEPLIEPGFEALFFGVAAFVAWRWGFRAALLSTAFAAVSLDYLFLPPHYTLRIFSWEALLRLLLFVIIAASIAWLIDRLVAIRELVHISDERFRVAIRNSPIFVFAQDRDLRYTWAYNTILLGVPPESVIGKTDEEVLGKENAAPIRAVKEAVLARATGIREEVTFHLRGTAVTMDLALEPRLSPAGDVNGLRGAAMDITDRKRAEGRLRVVQKTETLGVLAAGLAHQFNNLLMGISGNIALAQEAAQSPDTRMYLESAARSGERAALLVSQLLAYAGKTISFPDLVNLNEIARHSCELMQDSLPRTIRCEIQLGGGLPPVKADPEHIRQILFNLFTNAAEAIGSEPGMILVSTGVKDLAGPEMAEKAIVPEGAAPGSYAYLEVSDSGCGMDPAVQSKAFDPFFSTKFLGRGLGLAAVQGIARTCGAIVEVHSAPGRGSAFRVLFPAAASRA